MPKPIGLPCQDTYWAITESGLAQYNETLASAMEGLKARVYDQYEQDDDDDDDTRPSPLLRTVGSTGIISIKGPLVNSDSWLNELFGLVSYTSIRSALIEAATHPRIDRIMLDIDSPGGAVNGVTDTAELVSTIDKQIKPVFAFTDGNMASGAYWIGCSAREVFASQVSNVGSIGVVVNHMERSKQLEMAGIKATVIRAGKYKQVGNPNEPLTEEGLGELQGMVDALYKIFVTHVSSERGKSYAFTDQHMAQGRVFLGETAVEVGLVDHVSNFDATLAAISAKTVDRNSFSFENNGIGANMSNNKKPLAAAVEAALIAAGHIGTSDAAATAPAIDPSTSTETEGNDTAPAVTPDATAGAAPDVAPEADNSKENLATGVEVLKAQLRERDDQLVDAKVENRALAQQLKAAEASLDGLKAVAVKSLNAMQVALNKAVVNYDDVAAAEVLASHEALSAEFAKSFPIGGVAAVETGSDAKTKRETAKTDSIRAARLAATTL